jgi:hypothetical protein
VWIKAGKPVEKTGETTSQAPKKKHLSPSTRRRNGFGSEPVYVHLISVDRSLFCRFCWNIDGLGVAVVLVGLR